MSTTTAPSASDQRTEELRLALVLNGGVSLAVWMSGVCFELNRLVRETHPVYRALLQLTGTTARIDVISGTSAGGINGAALALAQVHDRSLFGLREVWLRTAGLERLLRDPDDADPRSLLRGDDWFLPQIEQAFADLAQGPRRAVAESPVLLNLTSTLLDGMVHRRLDDFGATVEDKVHRAKWRFERLEGAGDAFAQPRIVRQLAVAARSTASFPVAFEPVEVDPESALFKGTQPLLVRLEPDQPLAETAFLLDGGILDNQPFEAAFEGIARLPALGNTRRVLAYVVPDPAATAERRQPARPGEALPKPALAEVAWRSLVSIPASQSIANHMARVRAQNDDTSRRWQRLVGVVRHVGAASLLNNAAALLPAYRARRIDGVIDYLLDEIETGLAQGSAAPAIGMRRATRQWLRSTWRATDASRAHLWAHRVPQHYAPATALVSAQPARWPWGLFALEFLSDFTIEVLRRTQRLRGLITRWHQPTGSEVAGPPLPRPEAMAYAEGDLLERSDGALLRERPPHRRPIGDPQLKPLWEQAYALARSLRQRRGATSANVEHKGREGFVRLVQTWSGRGGERPPEDAALALIDELLGDAALEATQHAADARALCALLAALQKPMQAVFSARAAAPQVRTDIDETVTELRALHGYLFDALPGDASDALDRIAWRVLALEVFEVSAGSRAKTPNVQAELVQISARLRSAWGGSDDPAAKLNGMQLGHFGAFYKRSWRANDWTFGRLDGIDRAVRIALNPDALQRRYGCRQVRAGQGGPLLPASSYVREYLRGLAVDTAEPALREFLLAHWARDEQRIAEELQWLDQAATVPPPVLECCALALTRRLQLEALRRELPEMAESLIAERDQGAPPSPHAGVPLLARLAPDGRVHVPSPEHAVELVSANLLGSERLDEQPGTDLFTRTASQGLATAHAALSSRHAGLDAVQVLLRVTEWPVRILYWLAHRLSQGGSTGAAFEGAVLGVGAALVAGSLLTDQLPSAAVGMGWALLAGAIGATLLRRLALGWLLAALLLVGVYWLAPGKLWTVGSMCLALWLLLQRWSAGIAMAGIVLLAAWWSAGASLEAVQWLWQRYSPFGADAPAAPTAELLQQVQRLQAALVPALGVAALVLVSALSRTVLGSARRLGRRTALRAGTRWRGWWRRGS